MAKLGELVQKVRSKNAGPFWITVDVFCGDAEVFERAVAALGSREVAALYDTPSQTLKRFDIADLNVIKFSFPRQAVQGTIQDRDLHGASFAVLLAEMEV